MRFFRSVVARRVFFLFVICALVPITTLAFVAYLHVAGQLERQSAARLRQGSKMVGMATLERLQVFEQRLNLLSANGMARLSPAGSDLRDNRIMRDFVGIAFESPNSGRNVLYGTMPTDFTLPTGQEFSRADSGRALLRLSHDGGEVRVLLGQRAELGGHAGIIWAQLDPEFLWNAGLDAKPPETDFCVYDAGGATLFCSQDMSSSSDSTLQPMVSEARGVDFEWSDGGERYLAAAWQVFMRFGYGTSDWTVVLLQPRSTVLAPVTGFRTMFAYSAFLVLLGVFLLSSVQIRRSLRPLEALRLGIDRLAKRDFDTPVDVHSGDEFETLAASFNDMSTHLRNQFAESERLNAALRDTTDELAEHGARLSTILDTAADGIIVVNEDARIETMNETALAMFECAEQDVQQTSLEAILPGFRLGDVVDRSPMAGNGRRRNGEEFPIELTSATASLDGHGVSVVMVRDVTERVAAERERETLERQLRQAQKMETIGTLAGGIAHDFNNILSPIIGYVDLSLMDAEPGSELEDNLDQVRGAATRAKDLVRQILSFSRQNEQEATVVTLRVIVHEAVRLLKASLPATIRIVEQFDDSRSTVLADPTQLHQVVMNLCTNAYHAMRETGGELRVGINREQLSDPQSMGGILLDPGDYVRLTVSDTGIGMSAETLERIFEPFFTTKGPQEGTGLGLSVVHGIVEDHGGAITVDSTLGRGTTFTIYLPQVVADADGDDAEVAFPTGCQGRLLVVDDDEQVVRVQARVLERSGYQVMSATSPATALQRFESAPTDFDLIVTDHTMPQMTGVVLAKEIWSIRPEIPIILTSGYGDRLTDDGIRAAGFATFIKKPLRPIDLAQAVRLVLATPSTTHPPDAKRA